MRRGLLIFAFLAVGCPNPRGEFDKFSDRQSALDLSVQEPDLPKGMLSDISGKFLLSVGTTIDMNKPLQFIADNRLTLNTDGTGTLDLDLQPLSAMDRMPVGNKITRTGIAVAADGSFEIVAGTVMIPGAANPITGGEIVADLTLVGSIRSVDSYCGTIKGKVLMPIMLDLAGSTWSAVRVPASGVLPPPEVKCPSGMPDMSMPADMSMPPDMAVPADMVPPEDLTSDDV
jgi:hypothetical protein